MILNFSDDDMLSCLNSFVVLQGVFDIALLGRITVLYRSGEQSALPDLESASILEQEFDDGMAPCLRLDWHIISGDSGCEMATILTAFYIHICTVLQKCPYYSLALF